MKKKSKNSSSTRILSLSLSSDFVCLSFSLFLVSLPPPSLSLSASFITHHLIHVHGCVGEEDACVLNPLGMVHANLLLQQEPCITTSQR